MPTMGTWLFVMRIVYHSARGLSSKIYQIFGIKSKQ